jgi:hypothetical protein
VFKKSNLSGKVERSLSDGCDTDRCVVEKELKLIAEWCNTSASM